MKNEYEIRGAVTAMLLRPRRGDVAECLIDTADLDTVSALPGRWYVSSCNAGRLHYVIGGGGGQAFAPSPIKLHRLLLNAPSGLMVDHINGDGLDNRRANLRLATRNLNNRNGRTRSMHRGVYWDKRENKWGVYITIHGRTHALGRYVDLDEAKAVFHTAFTAAMEADIALSNELARP